MKLYKFTANPGTRVALTKDESGSNLPKGDWTPAGEMNIDASDPPRIGTTSTDILAAVDKDGYHILPEAA